MNSAVGVHQPKNVRFSFDKPEEDVSSLTNRSPQPDPSKVTFKRRWFINEKNYPQTEVIHR
jgi:hypothetical protein